MGTNVKLSNVIGAPFSDYVLLQLYIRAARNSTTNRTNEEVLFLANKTAWARLVSSVNIANDILGLTYKKLDVDYKTPDALAKNWILEAGTSKQDGNGISLRSGIGPDGAYGLGGTEELGYRPMPGLTGVTIETTGRLGSLRQATINFKVWNMDQLNVIEALYFRLGYSMLLEWGHTQYFDNKSTFERSGIYGIDDPFAPKQRKEVVQQAIALKVRNSFGNYDGMLGIVSNFSWSMNQDGGYDCTVKLVGLGSVMDSMRINQAYKLPDGLLDEYKKNKSAISAALQAELDEIKRQLAEAQKPKQEPKPELLPVPKTLSELSNVAATYDSNYNTLFTLNNAYYKASEAGQALGSTATLAPDFYYTPTGKPGQDTLDDINRLRLKYGGLYKTLTAGSSPGNFNFTAFIPDNASKASINTAALDDWAKAYLATLITPYEKPSETNYRYPIQFIFDNQTATKLNGVNKFSRLPNNTEAQFNFTLKSGTRSLPINGGDKEFYLKIGYSLISANQQQFYPTQGQIIDALGTWFDGLSTDTYVANNSRTISDVTFRPEGTGVNKQVIIKGTSDVVIKQMDIKTDATVKSKQDVVIRFTFETNDTGLLLNGERASQIGNVQAAVAKAANTGDANGSDNKASVTQTEAPEGFASALEAMLVIVKAQAQSQASKVKGALMIPIPIKSQTEKFFQDGIMNGVLNPSNAPIKVPNPSNSDFNLVQYAGKGFNSQLMIDPLLYNDIPAVDFDTLCKAFIIRYPQGDLEGGPSMTQAPVYIQLGYLLAFLNNMCLIYDSPESKIPTNNNPTKGTPKRPYVYIDFNPETNFCLTSPQQLSVDPLTCLIPLDGDKDSYRQIFPENLRDQIPNLFDPGSAANLVSGGIHGAGLYYKSNNNAYQGKVMNILLNVDYLLDLTRSFAGSDDEHAVRLEPFLNRILVDINKALGNTNAFRVAYRDDSNTIQIQDDQWVPSLVGEDLSESSLLSANQYNSKLKTDPKYAGLIPISGDPKELPVVGNLSLARQFQLRSVMSTKLASMIAISAQAATGSVNAKDHSSLSFLNQNFQDRYKPYIQDASNGEAGTNNNSKSKVKGEANDQRAAELFNEHVISIYSTFSLSTEKIDLAKNYYIERMSKVKSGDAITSAAPFIPAELEMTLDGISGIIMGNAFTVPQDRLPLSLRGENGLAKIAFIVTGLTHTIQSNEWLTKIKGQMIKLRQETKIPSAKTIVTKIQDLIATGPLANTQLTGQVVEDAINVIKSFEGLASAKPGNRAVYVTNPTPDTTVYAYSESGDYFTIGWGTTYYKTGVNAGKAVKAKDYITVAQADAEIRAEALNVYKFIQKNLTRVGNLSNGQLVALISLGYNLGTAGLRKSPIWEAVESGAPTSAIAQIISTYGVTVKKTGAVATGLISRRKQESQLYLS